MKTNQLKKNGNKCSETSAAMPKNENEKNTLYCGKGVEMVLHEPTIKQYDISQKEYSFHVWNKKAPSHGFSAVPTVAIAVARLFYNLNST